MQDLTFDIAMEYISKMNLSHQDLVELNNICNESHAEEVARARLYSEGGISLIPESYIDEEEYNDTLNIDDDILSNNEYEKPITKKEAKISKRIRKVCNKYCKDSRLFYSNDFYYQNVFSVALQDVIEKALDKNNPSIFDRAKQIIDRNKELINNYIPESEGNVYPEEIFNQFDLELEKHNKDFVWYHDSDYYLNIIITAFHYKQEIDESKIPEKKTWLNRLYDKSYFYKFFRVYTFIPYMIQETMILILMIKKHGLDIPLWLEDRDKGRKWVTDNYVQYINFMLFCGTLFWVWLITILH